MKGTRVVWPYKRHANVETFEVPEVGAGQVLIKTSTTLVSTGTERAHLLGMPNTPNDFPMYPGYSNVGRVLECGPGATHLAPGDRVLSYSPHASHVVVAESNAVKVPEVLATRSAVFGSLLTIALQGVRKANIELGTCVAVMGAGMIGLFASQWARAAGASEVIVIEPLADRRRLSTNLGATSVYPTCQALEQRKGQLPSVVIDATGTSDSILGAMSLCRHRGTVVILGSPRGTLDNVNFYSTVHLKGLRVIGAHDSIRPALESTSGYWTWADEARLAMEFMVDGRINTDSISRHHYNVADAGVLYLNLMQGSGPMANLIDWPH